MGFRYGHCKSQIQNWDREGKHCETNIGYDDKTLCQNGDETDETNERFKAQQGASSLKIEDGNSDKMYIYI